MKPLICKEILDNHPTLPMMDDWCCILRHAIAIVWCISYKLNVCPSQCCLAVHDFVVSDSKYYTRRRFRFLATIFMPAELEILDWEYCKAQRCKAPPRPANVLDPNSHLQELLLILSDMQERSIETDRRTNLAHTQGANGGNSGSVDWETLLRAFEGG